MKLLSSDARNTTAFAISSGVPNLPSGTVLEIIFKRCWPVSEETSRSFSPGVSVAPGLTAFTRMRRSLRSVVNVRAKERTAALVALYTLFDANPLLPTTEAFRMIDAPSESSGNAFCTVNRTPFTLMSKIESKNSSVIVPKGAYLATPAFANTISSLPFSRLICAKRRSRSPRFDTSPWMPVTFLPMSLTAVASSESRRPVMKTYAPSFTNAFAVARPMPLLPPVMSAIFPSRLPMSFSLATAPDHEVRDDDLNGLVFLVERRRSHLDQSLIRTRPRRPYLEHLALGPQLIPRSHGLWPAELVEAGAHDAAGGVL